MFAQLQSVFCPQARLPSGWARDVEIDFTDGLISNVRPASGRNADALQLSGPVVAGMPNVHSHAFQRAMAGLAEFRGTGQDNFWVWRDTMYRFAQQLDPDDLEVVAELLYVELLLGGYTSIGEFHYLHHGIEGKPYDDPAESSLRHLRAARSAGIRSTQLPVLYSRGGFDGRPLNGGQLRFGNTVDSLLVIRSRLLEESTNDPLANVGVAIHSLRAVSTQDIANLLDGVSSQDESTSNAPCPIHIHVAEQTAEVRDCQTTLGARPVEHLLSTQPVNEHWCLVHATHVTSDELRQVIRAKATIGLCPTTEANLGDGMFPAVELFGLTSDPRICVGSDSHVATTAADELRLLEYGQRLREQKRNLLAAPDQSNGASLYSGAARHGSTALGFRGGEIAPGAAADLVVLRPDYPLLAGRTGDALLDTYVFCGGAALVRDVIVGGRHIVQDGSHPRYEPAAERFRQRLSQFAW